jgi:hypothetical protein
MAGAARAVARAPLPAALETGRESIRLDDFVPLDFGSIHIPNLGTAKVGDRRGVGVVEQIALGPHQPCGRTGFLDGHRSQSLR